MGKGACIGGGEESGEELQMIWERKLRCIQARGHTWMEDGGAYK
jgi:hypothetical protein